MSNRIYYGVLGVVCGTALTGGMIAVDFWHCAQKISSSPVAYPEKLTTPVLVDASGHPEDNPRRMIATSKDASGRDVTLGVNMVVLREDAYFSWRGPQANEMTWDEAGISQTLSYDSACGVMTLARTASGVLGSRVASTTHFDRSGASTSVETRSLFGRDVGDAKIVSDANDAFKFDWAQQALSRSLQSVADALSVKLKADKKQADESFQKEMSSYFIRTFASMQNEPSGSLLGQITPTREGVQRKSGYLEMNTGTAQVRLYDDQTVENIQTLKGGDARVSVVVDPRGNVMVTHETLSDKARRVSFTHMLMPDGSVSGFADVLDGQTGVSLQSAPLKEPLQTKDQMKTLGKCALVNAVSLQYQTMMWRKTEPTGPALAQYKR